MYAIVDIETTGGLCTANRIMEVAVMVHDGHQIIEEYQTLINPDQAIPGFITGLTGLSMEMVQNAPFFNEIAAGLHRLLSDKIFVAHNVNFDYNFIKEEFRRAGMEFNRPKLCTVRLGRQLFPGLGSYSLGRICEHTEIRITDRHRAAGDATATAKLFGLMLSKDDSGFITKALKRNSGEAFLPPHIPAGRYADLPESPGVYYFHDAHGQVIYVGKALNIKSRFKGHFSGGSKSNQYLKSEIHDVSYELTGSDFLALLLEALEIKRLWPKYNRSQKVKATSWGIYQYEDALGYQRFQIAKTRKLYPSVYSFTTHAEAWAFLIQKIKEYQLCPKLCGIQKSPGACYSHQQMNCEGACCGKESVQSYNDKIIQMISSVQQQRSKILIKEKGRRQEEHAAILFDQGLLSAYGFIDTTLEYKGTEEVISSLKKVKPVPETSSILKTYLANAKAEYVEIEVFS